MRRAARKDSNHAEIVSALEQAGCSVVDLSGVGKGCPDISVGFRGVDQFLEIKDGRKPPSDQKLTPDQVVFHRTWRGRRVAIVRSVDEALRAVLGGVWESA